MNEFQTALATVLGSMLILTAVWLLLFRREAGASSAKIFGIEVSLSTPGLAVLAAGCGLLLAPSLFDHRPGGWPALWSGTSTRTDAASPGPAVQQQTTVVSKEQEANNAVGAANIISLGQTVSGTFDSGDRADYYRLEGSRADSANRKRIIVRTSGPLYCCVHLRVWNQQEEELARGQVIVGETISQIAGIADDYLIRVSSDEIAEGETSSYELFVSDEQTSNLQSTLLCRL